MYVHTYMYIYINICVYTYIYIHIYIHTHRRAYLGGGELLYSSDIVHPCLSNLI